MKNRLRQHFLLGLMLVTALLSLVSTAVFAATNDSTYLVKADGTVQTGNTLTVDVDAHLGGYWWGGGPSSTNGTITYPANLLQVTSVDTTTNAAFPNTTATYSTPGTITYSGRTNPFTYTKAWSDAHIFRIYFKALAAGTANVNITAASYDTGSGPKTGGTYTIVAPPPVVTPSPTPKPTPKPSTSPKPSPSKTPVPSATPSPSATPGVEETPAPTTDSDGGLAISNVEVTTTRQKNSISWSLNNASTAPTFVYGTSKSDQKNTGTVTKLTDTSYSTDLSDVKPGTLYYFTIKATTSDQLKSATYNGTFTTRGFPVQLTIQENGILAAGAKVKIGERSFVANKDAIISTELGDGTFTASITTADSPAAHSVQFTVAKKTIPAGREPDVQLITLNAVLDSTGSESKVNILGIIGGGIFATLLVIGGIVGFLLYRRRQNLGGEAVVVDSDFLTASYGTSLEEIHTQTPEPNLEAGQAFVSDVAPPVEQAPYPEGAVAAASLQAEPPVEQAFDPSTMLLPPESAQSFTNEPAYEQPAAVSVNPSDPPATETASTEVQPIDEQLSDPVMSVESIENTVPESATDSQASSAEEAIYHPETGELDIIHGHNTPSTSAQLPPVQPAAPQTGASQ